MNSLVIATISTVCAMGGLILGIGLHLRLPGHHLNEESQEVVKLAAGLIGTMAALVLGLLIASASTAFDAEAEHIEQLGASLFLLDRNLDHYGPEANEIRTMLHGTLTRIIEDLNRVGAAKELDSSVYSKAGRAIFTKIRDLTPKTEAQKVIQAGAIEVIDDVARTRWNLIQGRSDPIPIPFLVVLLIWIAVLFICFGLVSPLNATVVSVLFVSALTVAGAMLLIVELGDPFEGLLQVSVEPLSDALQLMGH